MLKFLAGTYRKGAGFGVKFVMARFLMASVHCTSEKRILRQNRAIPRQLCFFKIVDNKKKKKKEKTKENHTVEKYGKAANRRRHQGAASSRKRGSLCACLLFALPSVRPVAIREDHA